MNENRIMGPGYYPRRPGTPVNKIVEFSGAAYALVLYNHLDQEIDSVFWRGSGLYQCVRPLYPEVITKWSVCAINGTRPATGTGRWEPGTFSINLRNDSPARADNVLLRWTFGVENPCVAIGVYR